MPGALEPRTDQADEEAEEVRKTVKKFAERCEVQGCLKTSEWGLRLLRADLILIPDQGPDILEPKWFPIEPGISLCDEHMDLVKMAVQDVLERKLLEVDSKKGIRPRKERTCEDCALWEKWCYGPTRQECPPDKPFINFVSKGD